MLFDSEPSVYAVWPNGRHDVLIIRRYVFREVSQSFAAVLAVLLLVFLSHRFVRFLTDAAAGHISSDLIFQLLALKVAAKLAILLPLALFVGVLLGLGRLYRDSEVTAMSAGGVGLPSITRHVLGFAGAVAVFTLLFAIAFGPRLSQIQESVLAKARGDAEVTGVVPGRFKSIGKGDQVVYVERLDLASDALHRVFVQLENDGRQQILVSEKAYQTIRSPDGGEIGGVDGDLEGQRFVVMENGYRYEGVPGQADYTISRFERHAVRIDRFGDGDVRQRMESRSTASLIEWGLSRAGSQASSASWAELQWRLSMPISALLLGALAVPLARSSPRQGRYGKLLWAVLVYFAYSNALGVARRAVESGELVHWIGVWPVHAVVLLVTLWLIRSPAVGRAARRSVEAAGPRAASGARR